MHRAAPPFAVYLVLGFVVGIVSVGSFPKKLLGQYSHNGMSEDELLKKHQLYTSQGLRIRHLDGFELKGSVSFSAGWSRNSKFETAMAHGMTSDEYQQQFDRYIKLGFRPLQVDGYAFKGSSRYNAIWEKSSGPPFEARHAMSSALFLRSHKLQQSNGYRLIWLNGFSVNGKQSYSAIWEKSGGPERVVKIDLTSQQYQQEFNKQSLAGYSIKQVTAFNDGGVDRYAAIWEKTTGAGLFARHRLSSIGYQNLFENQFYRGGKLTHIAGYSLGGLPQYAAIFESGKRWDPADLNHIDSTIYSFMKKHSVPGAAVALVKNERLVFAQGYGALDPMNRPWEAPGPSTLFRVASVSKPITGTMIMKLVQDGKLRLTDRVFGPGSILGTDYGSKPYSTWEKSITVEHLLTHTAGGNQWNNKNDGNAGPPMFQKVNYNHKRLIGWILDERNLETAPGKKYDYSNFGYSVLGRVIEKKTGKQYEAAVRESLFKPYKISNAYVASDRLEDRRMNEAVYGSGAYTMPVRRMDAHGGWAASPVALMKFLVRADGFPVKRDILDQRHYRAMTTGSSVNSGYGKGWVLTGKNVWHNGSFNGSGAILVRAGNGTSWVFLMTSRWKSEADGMMWQIVNGIKRWPQIDLF